MTLALHSPNKPNQTSIWPWLYIALTNQTKPLMTLAVHSPNTPTISRPKPNYIGPTPCHIRFMVSSSIGQLTLLHGLYSCTSRNPRKELRDLTPHELLRFQRAIEKLRLHDNTDAAGSSWERIRDLYLDHVMLAYCARNFLLWHRMFLRHVEMKLQTIDCSVTLPYFDFTTDAGAFREAIIWQPNHFGGDGSDRSCVYDHPFGVNTSWTPCIRRKMDSTWQIPSLLEVARALSNDDFLTLNRELLTVSGYLHVFIGGDMATAGSVYDPVFLPIHAFIDFLFWQWQERHPTALFEISHISDFHTALRPFAMSPVRAYDLGNLCVTYVGQGQGRPCNVSEGEADVTYQVGYDWAGFDSVGFDIHGFNRQGGDLFLYVLH